MGLSIREKTVNDSLMIHVMLCLIGIKRVTIEMLSFMGELIAELVESDRKGNRQQ